MGLGALNFILLSDVTLLCALLQVVVREQSSLGVYSLRSELRLRLEAGVWAFYTPG